MRSWGSCGVGVVALAGVLGCAGNPEESTEGSEASTDETSEVPDPTGDADDSDGTTGGAVDSSDDGQTTVPEPVCGNGEVEAPEQCDDGNRTGGDGCEVDCTETISTLQWQDIVAGDASLREAAQGIAIDGDGDVIAVGFVVHEPNDPDIWVRKYTAAGEIVFTQTFDPSEGGDDRAAAVAIGSGDSIAVVGSTNVGPGDTDWWIAKLDATGGTLWETTVPGGEGSGGGASGVAVDGLDRVVAVGSVRTSMNDPDIFLTRRGGNDGVDEWSQTVAGPAELEDRATGVVVLSEDRIVVTGYVSLSGFDTDVWLGKYDAQGQEVWTTTHGSQGGGADAGLAISLAPDDHVAVAGTAPGETPGTLDAWLGRFDANGVLQWQRGFGSPAVLDDEGFGVGTDPDGGFVVIGSKSVSAVDTDIWIRKWDAIGDEVWTQNVAGAGMSRDQGLAIAVASDGGFYAAGEIRPTATNDGDLWIAGFAGATR